VRQGQNGQKAVAAADRYSLDAGLDVGDDIFVSEHHPFGVAHGAGGVENFGEILLFGLRAGLDFFPLFDGLTTGEKCGKFDCFFLLQGELLVVEGGDKNQVAHVQLRHFVDQLAGDEEPFCTRVADDVVDLGFVKVGKNGHCHRPHGGDRQIGDAPGGRIFAEQGDPVARLDTALTQAHDELINLLLDLPVGDRFFIDERKGDAVGEFRHTGAEKFTECPFLQRDHKRTPGVLCFPPAFMRGDTLQDEEE